MKRMGENIDIGGEIDTLISNKPIFLKEGLIATYNSKDVLNAICDDFQLAQNGKRGQPISSKIKGSKYVFTGDAYIKTVNDEEIIVVILDIKDDSFVEKLTKRMSKYGWSFFKNETNTENQFVIFFEKRYPLKVLPKHILCSTNKLYHITPRKVLSKILKQGLIPKKSKTYGYENEPRVYLWGDKPDDFKINNSYNPSTENVDNVLLSIDVNKLNPTHAIYFDNRTPYAFFSLEPISPNAIEVEI